MQGRPDVIVVGGLDPTAGAGVAADVLTLALLGCRGRPVISVLTAQGGGSAARSRPVNPDFLRLELEGAAAEARVRALKSGALGSAGQVEALVAFIDEHRVGPVVVDPVIRASLGGTLLDAAGVEVLRRELLPRAFLVTPNLAEAAVLAGQDREAADRDGMERAALSILERGVRWVLVKGGHLGGEPCDLLAGASGERSWLEGRRVEVRSTRGTGCVLASAIAAGLAAGRDVEESCLTAKTFLARALASSPADGPAPDLVSLLRALDRPGVGSDS